MLQNFLWRKSGKSRFPLKPKQQEMAILREINSSKALFYLKIALFCIFEQVQTLEQTLFNILILGKSRFPPKEIL